jgi:hypothetical protein
MASLITEFKRRVEKIISGSRPKVPPVGTNHVDDYSLWTSDTIYKGELGINLTEGTLFTQDGRQPVEFNKEDAIMGGHILQTSGVSSQYLSVTQGKIRLQGKTYWTPTPVDVVDTNIYIEPNTSSYPRIDTICIKGDPTLYYSGLDLYGTEFYVVKGTPATEPEPPDVPSGYYFVGVCWIYPNGLPTSTLYPLSHSQGVLSTFPLSVVTTKDFVQQRRLTVHPWNYTTLYFSQQIVKYNQELYWVITTHQSDDSSIQNDIDDGKIIKICCGSGGSGGQGTQGNAFSDIGSYPTDGNWTDGLFTWTPSTLILDAFDDINKFLLNQIESQPSMMPSNQLNDNTIEAQNGFSARWYDTGLVEANVFTDQELPIIQSITPFRSYENGEIFGYSDFNGSLDSTSVYNVGPSLHPPATNINETGSVLSLDLVKNDAFAGNEDLEGKFYNVFTFELAKTGAVLPASDTIQYMMGIEYDSSFGNTTAELEFYVEQITAAPLLSSIDIKGVWTSKYVSGVPVLEEADIVKFSFDAENCVGYFYHKDHIVKILGPYVNQKLLPQTDSSCTSSLPFTALSQIVQFTDAESDIIAGSSSTSLTQTFNLTVHNAKGVGTTGIQNVTSVTTSSYKIFIDDVSDEAGVRYTSGIGTYPTSGYGNLYDSSQSQEDLTTGGNEELQLFCGVYQYPSQDFSGSDMVDISSVNVSGPDYSGLTGTRWATFNLGTISDQKYVNLVIKGATGIFQDLDNGTTFSNNITLQVRVDGSSPTLGWVDANEAYNPISLENPTNDGDPALDLGSSTPTIRRVTFGQLAKSGTIHVRIGIDETSGVTFTNIDNYEPTIINQDWAYFTIGNIITQTEVSFTIDNSNGTIAEDFVDGIKMTENLEIQLRIVGSSSTDWLDANSKYISGDPENYNEAALDVENSTATERTITFGSTPRTGEVQVRIRGNYKVFSGVTIV